MMRSYHEDIENPSLIQTKVDEGFNPMYVIGMKVVNAISYFEKHNISYIFQDSPEGMGSTALGRLCETPAPYSERIMSQGGHIHKPGTHIYKTYSYHISNKDEWILVGFQGVA
jgi:hypothetical protein